MPRQVGSSCLPRPLLDMELGHGRRPIGINLDDNVAFGSPSASAAVVNAGNMNGRTNWKVAETGQTYQEWYEQRLQAAGIDGSENE